MERCRSVRHERILKDSLMSSVNYPPRPLLFPPLSLPFVTVSSQGLASVCLFQLSRCDCVLPPPPLPPPPTHTPPPPPLPKKHKINCSELEINKLKQKTKKQHTHTFLLFALKITVELIITWKFPSWLHAQLI